MILGSGLIQASGWPQASDWIIRDEFTGTVAAGSVNGTAATPGPGTRTVTDTGNVASVGSGIYAHSAPATGGQDPTIIYGGVTRDAGVAMIVKAMRLSGATAATANPSVLFSYQSNPSWYRGYGVIFSNGVLTVVIVDSVNPVDVGATYTLDAWKTIAVIARTTGAMVVDIDTKKLLWVYATGTDATLYPVPNVSIAPNRTGANVDLLRCIALPAPFDTDDGLATDTKSGSVAAGTTFTHEADALIEATITTVPSADNIDIVFRQQDASNYWICRIATGGDISLQEVVAGSPTQRGVAAGVVSNGHRVVVIADGTTIKGYSNNTLRWTYSSATNFATATAGEVDALGTGGAVSNVKTWPRTLSGTADSILNKVSA